jgi:hypothetical protein
VRRGHAASAAPGACEPLDTVAVNAPYYREQLHALELALAIDNIRRDPPAYLSGVAYRALRVFFIEGTDDPHTTQQFSGGSRVYGFAKVASIMLIGSCAVGVWAAWRRGAAHSPSP